jgi:predicted HicB family RNase H-like nuclease
MIFTLKITPDLHDRIRRAAFAEGISMAEFLRVATDKHLKRFERKMKIKKT